jgi:hypothetical protein
MSVNPLVRDAIERMKDAGIDDAETLRERYAPQQFGNAEAVFRVGKLILRFVRDRGQDFLDLGWASAQGKFHQFDDVDVATGWRSLQKVVSKREPEGLASVVERFARHRSQLEEALAGERERLTRSRIESAAKARGEALFGGAKR